MPFTLHWTSRGAAEYQALKDAADVTEAARLAQGDPKSSKSEGLFKQASKAIQHLQVDPRHPGLHSHEFHSLAHPYNPKEKVWESYIQNRTPGAFRVFWCYGRGKGEITILAITPHP